MLNRAFCISGFFLYFIFIYLLFSFLLRFALIYHWSLTAAPNLVTKLVFLGMDGKTDKHKPARKRMLTERFDKSYYFRDFWREEYPGRAGRPGRSSAFPSLCKKQLWKLGILRVAVKTVYIYGSFPRSGISALAPGNPPGFPLLFDVATLRQCGCTKSCSPPLLFCLDCCIKRCSLQCLVLPYKQILAEQHYHNPDVATFSFISSHLSFLTSYSDVFF